ncbi:MAG: heme ABC exporter ATP-binding protein CcmA [Parvularculaceae bacterium]
MTPDPVQIGLEARDTGCDRAGAPIVRGVSFRLAPGEGLQLFGPNGSGKTSLLSLFAGLIAPAEGAINWTAEGATSARAPVNSIFFLGHDAGVKPALTAAENLSFWAAGYGAPTDAIDAALDRVGARGLRDMRAGKLSAGQKRRVDIARAVIANRPVWLLDEPAASLDASGDDMLRMLLNDHFARGGIAVIATHDDLGPGFARLKLAAGAGA